ncbi:hypothetical protein [Commensalibacter oyaizuii]|uniref:Uncharacterized protein n=1 Tax=Commensalibacter oyaizuii TaxID=3043873 RepID=A0ABT6Q262_9PROT|nr:hypothetical protein [Commensalibacter sp. TBRC 16381]MDI2091207.1 hypothetical protein [Commensalibacter sp. TBRC 16381]
MPRSQINAANGVAGLNANKQVTADINNNKVTTHDLQLDKNGNRLRFITNSPDTNNNMIDMFYNRDAGSKDGLGNILDANTFYFTNNMYGNNYRFNGTVKANGLNIAGHTITSPIPGGYEPIDPYNNDDKNSNLIFLSNSGYDWGNIKPNTLMIGGRTRNAVVGIKATCQNTGQGDQGGSCYQFTDMAGPQSFHRGGAGYTDGINMDMRTADNSPMDSIGGNTLIQNSDGSYAVKGNDYTPTKSVAAGETSFSVKGAFACGIGNGGSLSRCEMSGTSFINTTGEIVNVVKITAGKYDPKTDTTLVNLASGYKTKDPLTINSKLNIIYYASDGTAYAVEYKEDSNGLQYAAIYPALSEKEKNLTHARMAVWSNMANGMLNAEGGTNEDNSNVDVPNYYYGYADGFIDTILSQSNINAINKDTTKTSDEKNLAIRQNKLTKIYMRTYSYPGLSGDMYKWKTIRTALKQDPNIKSPGLNMNDQLDNQLAYACPSKNQLNNAIDLQSKLHIPNRPNCYDKENIPQVVKSEFLNNIRYTYNTNTHHYQKPTLFLGMIQKNFNLYTQQSYNKAPDSITREFDNEWDFPIYQDHDGQVSVRGLTMVFSGGGHPLATGSYMLRMAGFNHMPLGMKIDGIWPYGGKNIVTDAGFFLYKWAFLGAAPYLRNTNDTMSISGLGQAKTNQGSYQLMTYMSNDGNINNAKNNSLHLGLTKQNSLDPLQNLGGNQSPTCNDDGKCSVLGQVIFDPLGYAGGIALGLNHGENTKLGLIVDKNGNVTVNNQMIVDGKSVNDVINNALARSQINAANGVAGLNANKQVTADINNNKVVTHDLQLDKNGNRLRFITNSPDINNNMIDMFYNRDAGSKDGLGNILDANTFYFTNNMYGNNYRFNGTVKANSLNANSLNANIIQLNEHGKRLRFVTNSPDTNNNMIDMFYNRDAGNKDGLGNILDANTFYFTNNLYGNNYRFNGTIKADGMVTDNITVKTAISAPKIIGNLSTPSSSTASCIAGEFKDDTNYHYVCVAKDKWKRVALSDF